MASVIKQGPWRNPLMPFPHPTAPSNPGVISLEPLSKLSRFGPHSKALNTTSILVPISHA